MVEHDGQPYCKNCHKAHLGQGKGGFGLAVPLRPEIVKAPPPKPASLSSTSTRYGDNSRERQRREDEVNEEMSGISLSRRRDNPSPVRQEYKAPPRSPLSSQPAASRPVTSIDDMVASGMEVPMLRGRNGDTSKNEVFQSLYGSKDESGKQTEDPSVLATIAPPRQPDPMEESGAPIQSPSQGRSSSPLSKPTVPASLPSTPGRETIGSVRLGADGLPAPSRKDPIAMSRERERGLGGGNVGTAKTYSPRTAPQMSPASRSPKKGDEDGFGYSPASALSKMGLGSTVSAAAVGTPLCARCERPVCE